VAADVKMFRAAQAVGQSRQRSYKQRHNDDRPPMVIQLMTLPEVVLTQFISEFYSMVLRPRERDSERLLTDYVGTDSKYTLASNHTGMMVRLGANSSDVSTRIRAVLPRLEAIDLFLQSLFENEELKQEHKGCITLRM
jgi:hypothetical protein